MSAPLRLSVSVRNYGPRKGVPIARSFECWVRAALASHRGGRAEIDIALFGETAARELNRRYRSRDYATNVLSFPYKPHRGEKSARLGDLAFCPSVISREARAQRTPLRDHYAHLTVHGVLHLLGYDHQSESDAAKMETLERRVLAKLGIADPYA